MVQLERKSLAWLAPATPLGALALGMLFLILASIIAGIIRTGTRRMETHLSDVTALHFISELAQALTYFLSFVFFAHMVPELRALGTALLAGVSVVSIVVGLAAQNTLGNLIAGFSLVLYRQVRVGDLICLSTPKGVVTAKIQLISLGFTVLLDDQQHEVVVPNSVMMNSTVIRIGRDTGIPQGTKSL